jgi:hypothetical protein
MTHTISRTELATALSQLLGLDDLGGVSRIVMTPHSVQVTHYVFTPDGNLILDKPTGAFVTETHTFTIAP